MTVHNRTIVEIPLTWNRTRFEATRNKLQLARKLVEFSVNAQYEKQMRNGFSRNMCIEENIRKMNRRLRKHNDKLRILDNMIELASQSLRVYFDKRMEHVQTVVKEHCDMIQKIFYDEAKHWREIHSIMNQNLLNPDDIRSRNNFPRVVQQSPASDIETIEEEEEVVDGNTFSKSQGDASESLSIQIMRKSSVEAKDQTRIPSIKILSPSHSERSIFRQGERFSLHVLPLSAVRQPLRIVDTTFVVKAEETIVDINMHNDDENDNDPNGTYRGCTHQSHSYLLLPQPDRLFVDTQPNIPARLCFTPTILQERTVTLEDDIRESSSSSSTSSHDRSRKEANIVFPLLYESRMIAKAIAHKDPRFGQTFLLDIVKTEQTDDCSQIIYKRPYITDTDVFVVNDTNNSTAVLSQKTKITSKNDDVQPANSANQKISNNSRKQISQVKRHIHAATNTKPVLVSTRKTRSAARMIAEQEATAVKLASEKLLEKRRKTRKRKKSVSVDRLAETSDEETIINRSNNLTGVKIKRRKTKRHRSSRTDRYAQDTSDEDTDNSRSVESIERKRKTRERSKSTLSDHQQERPIDHEITKTKKKIKKFNELTIIDNQHESTSDFPKCKKSTRFASSYHKNESKTNANKRRIKNTRLNDNEQPVRKRSSRLSAKRRLQSN